VIIILSNAVPEKLGNHFVIDNNTITFSGGLRPPAIHRFPLRGKGCSVNVYYHREAVASE